MSNSSNKKKEKEKKKKKRSVQRQIRDDLKRKLSKQKIKNSDTRKQYAHVIPIFTQYCRAAFDAHTVEDCFEHIQDFIDFLETEGKSPSTIHTYAAAICRIYGVSMSNYTKPTRHTAEYTRGRAKPAEAYRTDRDMSSGKWKSTVKFNKAVGIRRDEIDKLKGCNLVYDESGWLCVEVRKGKGGKYQLQRILPEDQEMVKAYFKNKDAGERIFSKEELNNKLNYHALRADLAKRAYLYYLDRIQNEPGYAMQLEKEIRARWNKYNLKHKSKNPKPFDENDILGEYFLRGKNRKFALEHGLPLHFNKLALLATSIFHLSHWRNNVTVENYLLAL